ncbi:MAG: 6-phosphofructokinase [Candidatus Kapabacteria bacterium]|nr:6-phosphofructokinase [Ignavibacteriota bacterium]MCW5884806.1 6-phosphofructokinase [Candidatus Kapabacteria bacterium]
MKRIGIITSGGDCGGLNAVITGAARMGYTLGVEACLIPNGYAGLYNLNNLEPVVIDFARADKIHSGVAGSEAGHSRVKISKIQDPDKYNIIRSGLKKHNIDGLIIAGGDDTGSVVVDLIEEGINCVHVPKTMDLDLQTYSVGGDSTINRISKFTDELRTTGLTHNRALIIEVFGRYAGHTAFRGGIGADADCILIPEVEVDYEIVYNHFKTTYINRLMTSDVKGSTYIIVAAEGVKNKDGKYFTDDDSGLDSFGHKRLSGVGSYIRRQLENFAKQDSYWEFVLKREGIYVENIYMHPEIREVQLGHLVRAGQTSAYDVTFGKQAGGAAMLLMKKGIYGVTVVGVEGHDVTYYPTSEAIKQRYVDLDEIAFHESLGVCFGREPISFEAKFNLQEGIIHRYM